MNRSLVDAKEMGRILNVPPKSVYLYATRGEIPFLRIGRHLRFEPEEVIAKLKGAAADCIAPRKLLSRSQPDFGELEKLVERSLKTEKRSLVPLKGASKWQLKG